MPTPPPAAPPVIIDDLGHPLLPGAATWELFARAEGSVIRIELSTGRVTQTSVPELDAARPVSFLVGPRQAIIRPRNQTAGVLVPDGRSVRTLPAALDGSGPALPAANPEHLWIAHDTATSSSMTLFDFDGLPVGGSVAIPSHGSVSSDGAGYVLVKDTGGVYEARPDGLQRVTTGVVDASGPRKYLVVECDVKHDCATVVIQRGSGRRRTLPLTLDPSSTVGTISPDGAVAARITPGRHADPTLHLLNLNSGRDTPVPLLLDPALSQEGGIVWSPDSRWLFVVAQGRIVVIERRTGQITTLGTSLPTVHQIALRVGRP
ncbi:MAG: hypothetical protein H0T91_09175 [Propionibacteriaceae bacterium]|nr:hypothetical protein [Propionibacteriaceae bacterium]